MNPNYPFVAKRAGHKCEYCLAPESAFNFLFEIDHFVPGSVGGSDDSENLVLSCRSCNSYKAFHQLGLVSGEIEEGCSILAPTYGTNISAWKSEPQE